MPAKNKRPPVIPDIQGRFAAHVETTRLAYKWATTCIALREAGKPTQAKSAEQKARHWLKKAKALEAMVAAPRRTGGRA
jgi:hypothetical protein